jgi:pentatricopeptide repeat protein
MIVTYVKKPNGMWDEVTEFKNNLKTKHIQSAKVVLDFKEKKCVVNSLNREASYEDMIEFYKRMLGDRLTPHLPKD